MTGERLLAPSPELDICGEVFPPNRRLSQRRKCSTNTRRTRITAFETGGDFAGFASFAFLLRTASKRREDEGDRQHHQPEHRSSLPQAGEERAMSGERPHRKSKQEGGLCEGGRIRPWDDGEPAASLQDRHFIETGRMGKYQSAIAMSERHRKRERRTAPFLSHRPDRLLIFRGNNLIAGTQREAARIRENGAASKQRGRVFERRLTTNSVTQFNSIASSQCS